MNPFLIIINDFLYRIQNIRIFLFLVGRHSNDIGSKILAAAFLRMDLLLIVCGQLSIFYPNSIKENQWYPKYPKQNHNMQIFLIS
jgi:hypothetical protein